MPSLKVFDGTNWVTVVGGEVGGGGATLTFPFRIADTTAKNISLVGGTALPFLLAAGTNSNIPLVSP